MIQSLASEGPAYIELADDFEFNGTEKGKQIAQFFKVNKNRLPNFYQVFKLIALILPSNATSERLNAVFSTFQFDKSCLLETIQSGTILRFNNRIKQRKRHPELIDDIVNDEVMDVI